MDHCDPFAQYSELRPGTASVLWDLEPLGGTGDALPLSRLAPRDPVNIY